MWEDRLFRSSQSQLMTFITAHELILTLFSVHSSCSKFITNLIEEEETVEYFKDDRDVNRMKRRETEGARLSCEKLHAFRIVTHSVSESSSESSLSSLSLSLSLMHFLEFIMSLFH